MTGDEVAVGGADRVCVHGPNSNGDCDWDALWTASQLHSPEERASHEASRDATGEGMCTGRDGVCDGGGIPPRDFCAPLVRT